ncbi:hypothetical protein [Altererythrobacter sp. ZODW24]|uniref:hypothetical protein n=1 Tax=Altererythrobacter sp. ZODW24 TaxID=2185142 RepID=UPI0013B3BAFA|nr:hypothetical protein [Altererythrobacter sp. ZODW24]
MKKVTALTMLGSLAACNPPAADDYVERVELENTGNGGSEPLASPDAENAIWGIGAGEMRLLYGNPGQPPFLGISCEGVGTDRPLIRLVRYAPADADAKALFALVGNGTVARLKMDSTWTGKGWRWEGTVDAGNPDLDVLTGRRSVEATLPGAGSLILKPSFAPRDLIENCRSGISAFEEEADPIDEDEVFPEDASPD